MHKVIGSSLTVPRWPGGTKFLEYLTSRMFLSLINWDMFYWCLEIDTSSTTLFYQFTTGITCMLAEGVLLPYFQ
jgi:hypothetical protein